MTDASTAIAAKARWVDILIFHAAATPSGARAQWCYCVVVDGDQTSGTLPHYRADCSIATLQRALRAEYRHPQASYAAREAIRAMPGASLTFRRSA